MRFILPYIYIRVLDPAHLYTPQILIHPSLQGHVWRNFQDKFRNDWNFSKFRLRRSRRRESVIFLFRFLILIKSRYGVVIIIVGYSYWSEKGSTRMMAVKVFRSLGMWSREVVGFFQPAKRFHFCLYSGSGSTPWPRVPLWKIVDE